MGTNAGDDGRWRVKLDAKKLTEAIMRLTVVDEIAAQELPQVELEALGHVQIGAATNIYDTVPGRKYIRTGDYLRSLDARAERKKHVLGVQVSSNIHYARYIEFGQTHGAAQLQSIAAAQQDKQDPLSLGRSGLDYWIAGPVLTMGQAFSSWRLAEAFKTGMKRAVKG